MSHPLSKSIDYSDVQLQVFCDNRCSEWSPNGRQLMALTNVERGMLLHNLIVRAKEIDKFDKEGDGDVAAFMAQLNVDHPIPIKG